MLFRWNTPRTGNNAVKMPQVFHDILQFKRFTDLNLFKYVFNVIQNWETDALHFIRCCLFFVSSYGRRRWKKPAKDGYLAGGFDRLPGLIDSHGFMVYLPTFSGSKIFEDFPQTSKCCLKCPKMFRQPLSTSKATSKVAFQCVAIRWSAFMKHFWEYWI